MADIAAVAGVSQGLAYRYFDSKKALYKELVEHAVQVGLDAFAPLRDRDVTPGRRLALLLSQMIEMRHAHPEEFHLLDHVADLDGQSVPDAPVQQRRESFLGLLSELIVAGQQTGEVVAGEPDELVIAIAATLEGLTRFAIHNPDMYRKSPPSADIFLRMLAPTPK